MRLNDAEKSKAVEIFLDSLWSRKSYELTPAQRRRIRRLLGYVRSVQRHFRKHESYSLVTCFDPREPPPLRVKYGKQRAWNLTNWRKRKREERLVKIVYGELV